jgi:hypothetical protein
MTRIWALRLVFISVGLLVCLFVFRDTMLEAMYPTFQSYDTTYRLVDAILYDGWGVAILAAVGLYGLYRLAVLRSEKP